MTGGRERVNRLPLVQPDAVTSEPSGEGDPDGQDETDRRVAGVLLAAGTSSRFGETNKLVTGLDGDPLVRHAARTLVAAGLDPLVAVVGHQRSRVVAALDGLPFEVVENDRYSEGQATSVAAGVDALPPDVDAAVFALGDMPFVAPESVSALVDVYSKTKWTALAAAAASERGNPVLFDRRHFDALARVSGDRGGREILLSDERSALVETGDPGVTRDIDTPDDLDRFGGSS